MVKVGEEKERKLESCTCADARIDWWCSNNGFVKTMAAKPLIPFKRNGVDGSKGGDLFVNISTYPK